MDFGKPLPQISTRRQPVNTIPVPNSLPGQVTWSTLKGTHAIQDQACQAHRGIDKCLVTRLCTHMSMSSDQCSTLHGKTTWLRVNSWVPWTWQKDWGLGYQRWQQQHNSATILTHGNNSDKMANSGDQLIEVNSRSQGYWVILTLVDQEPVKDQ